METFRLLNRYVCQFKSNLMDNLERVKDLDEVANSSTPIVRNAVRSARELTDRSVPMGDLDPREGWEMVLEQRVKDATEEVVDDVHRNLVRAS